MRGAWRTPRRAWPGLTLIELLMAIALTGVLFALLLPLATGSRGGGYPWDRERAAFLNETTRAERGFIGVQLDPTSTEDGYPRIRAMVAGSPAHHAGAWPGDAILRVDGLSARRRGTSAVVRLITRGRPGTRVRLTVRRAGSGATRDLRVVRGSFYDVFLPGIAAEPFREGCPGTGRIWLWDARIGHPVDVFPGQRGWVRAIAFSQDGRVLATTGYGNSRTVLWAVGSR